MDFIQTTELPESIINIADPPKKGLYVIGNPWPENYKRLTVVGSRKISQYGEAVCNYLFDKLAGHPISIISGLALGTDALAYRLAIKHKLHTVAIPGSGLDPKVIYPASNRLLAKEIIDSGGGLVSEYEPLQKSAQWTFPRRNRLMAGLADAILVIEATSQSGTLITARLAVEYNRDVLAVPGSIFNNNSFGTNQLIATGAKLVTNADDILEALNLQTGPSKGRDLSDLSEVEQKIYAIIKSEPYTKDELIKKSKLDTTTALSVITMLELTGLLTERLGKIYWK